MKLKRCNLGEDGDGVSFMCPGCKTTHAVPVTGPKAWTFNGDMNRPTLSPSIVVWTEEYVDPEDQFKIPATRCHSFVRDGKIQFLSDCTHKLAGQTVELTEKGELK